MTPEEKNQRILQRKREELLKRANATPTASPTQEERLVSDGVKENLKAASYLAGVISKRTAELTQKGVVAAAEKAKQAKAQLDARRTRGAQEHRAVEEKPQDAPLTLEQEMLVRQLTSDAAAPVLVGAGDKGMWVPCDLGEDVDELVDGALDTAGMGGPSVDAKALSNEDTAALVNLSQQDAVEVLSVSAVPEGSNRPPEAASPEQPVTPIQPSPRSRWPWVLASLVAVASVAGAIYSLVGKNDKAPPSAPAPVAPVATPAAPKQLSEVVEAPVVAPAPAVLTEQAEPEPAIEKPEPLAAPDVTASATIAPQPKPSPKRATAPLPRKAPAPAAEPRNDWQQIANADLDAWAKKSGID